MALDSKVADILNVQINKELYSAYLYLDIADYYEDRGLKGFANWYMVQVEEEVAHAKILRRYLLDNGCKVTLEAIAKPETSFTDDVEPLKAALEHEQYVTASINECYAAAAEVHDLRSMKMLDWFIEEQGEEEANASEMITNMELFGRDCHGLHDLDREYATRAYTAPTMPM